MGYWFTGEAFNKLLAELARKYKIFAPVLLKGKRSLFRYGPGGI